MKPADSTTFASGPQSDISMMSSTSVQVVHSYEVRPVQRTIGAVLSTVTTQFLEVRIVVVSLSKEVKKLKKDSVKKRCSLTS